jgi:bifunctional non-homologous end joining protein LigD
MVTRRAGGSQRPGSEELAEQAKEPAAMGAAEAEPAGGRGVTLTNETRVIDETSGVTKGELFRYYGAVADALLPFAKGRPLSTVRCPGGLGKKSFFQKRPMPGMSGSVHRATARGQEVMHVADADGILELVQFGVVEIHGWGSRLPEPDKPDWIVLDLDPDEGLPYERVIDAALESREVLRSLGLESWVKTTGGKGLHVVAPFLPSHGWDAVKRFARAIAEDFARRAPDAFTAALSKAARPGKIFVDYLRNTEGATAVLPYSARARGGLTVAMPIAWEEIRSVHPRDFTVRTALDVLARRRQDPWADLVTSAQSLPPNLDELIAKTLRGSS